MVSLVLTLHSPLPPPTFSFTFLFVVALRPGPRSMASLPSTPKAAIAPTPAPTPDESRTPGKWRHPQLNEIVRRQNAETFGDRNLKKLSWNTVALVATWIFGDTFRS